ncbi:MAG: hypothetical protein K2J75_05990, partial [Clostridia bacterium]|nr:hypothetical protein [Clostridia bacterium]
TYMYTDLSKVETAHNDPTQSDTSTIVVDREQSHGSLQNPYVINTLAQWNYFAIDSSSGATDSNKVFVLGQDIDFSGQVSNVVDSFAGKFYGLGHTLLNFSNTSGTANNFGVFCQINDGAILADINLDNVTISSTAGRVGSLVGRTNGGDILNCHIKGSVAGTAKVPGSNNILEYDGVGGLVGDVKGDNVKVYIYRCSLDVKLTMTSQTGGASGGGLIGSWSCSSGTLTSAIYDCLVISDVTQNGGSSGSSDIWFGGLTNFSANLGEQSIENCVTYINFTDNSTTSRHIYSTFINGWPTALNKMTLKNIFTDGVLNKSNSSIKSLPSAIWFNGWSLSILNSMTLNTSNLNWFANSAVQNSGAVDFYAQKKLANTKYTGASGLTRDDMYAKVQNDMPADIWTQKSNITTSYMTNVDVTSTTGYTIDNSPLRNTSIKTSGFTIEYFNIKNGEKVPYNNDTTYNYKDASQLYSPTAEADHIFAGWTLDEMGMGAIYKNVPVDIYGDVQMYAVWDVPQANIVKESIISAESDGSFTKEYSQGSSLTMRGDISVTSMTSPVIQYKWHKNADTTILGTSSTYSISNVAETGDYVLDYVITDSVEP